MTRAASELAHLFRALKAPAAARALPKLADRARAEDWSYVLQQVNGSMAFLGTRPKGIPPHEVAPNHSNRMVLDEAAMVPGIATYSSVALRWLAGEGATA